MSLKKDLNKLIEERNGGVVSLNEIEQFCHANHYKTSNAERRLRHSESPNVVAIFNNKAIVGYKSSFQIAARVQTLCSSTPCFSKQKFGVCSCPKVNNQLTF